jgi:hypothetical protein
MGRKKKRGPKGGVKHQPGRGHDAKSALAKKKRFSKNAAKKRKQEAEESQRAWAAWYALPEAVKRILGPSAEPKMPRPREQ